MKIMAALSGVLLVTIAIFIAFASCQSPLSICSDGGLSIESYDGSHNLTLFDSPSIDPYYIYSQEDVDYLIQNNCTNILTRVIISPNSTSAANISLDGIQWIRSHLNVISSATLAKLSAPSLVRITGDFSLDNLTQLSNVNFSSLDLVGSLSMSSLPSLKSVEFPGSASGALNISETALERFQGIRAATSVRVVSNPALEILDLQNVEGTSRDVDVEIFDNGNGIVIDLSRLSDVRDVHIENCAALNLSRLQWVGNITVQNSLIPTLDMPKLEVVTGSLMLHDNTNLTHINVSKLVITGTQLSIQNNPKLSNLTNIFSDKLNYMQDVALVGNFSSISLPYVKAMTNLTAIGNITSLQLPQLTPPTYVDIESTYPSFDCSAFDKMQTLRHYTPSTSYTCQASTLRSSKDTAIHYPGFGKQGLSTGAKAGIGIGVSIGVIGIAVIVCLCCRRRRRRRARSSSSDIDLPDNSSRDGDVETLPTYRQNSDVELPKYQTSVESYHGT